MNDAAAPRPTLAMTCAIAIAIAVMVGPGPQLAAQTAEPPRLRHVHESVLPFSFEPPRDWEIRTSPLNWSSRQWLGAAPRGTRATAKESGALTVTLRGYQPELFHAPDPLARALDLVRDTLRGRPTGSRLEMGLPEPLTLGETPGTLVAYEIAASETEPAQRGLALAAVRGPALLFAEIRWAAADDEARRGPARTLLQSFRIDAAAPWKDERRPEAGPGDPELVFRRPADWPVIPVRTEDASRAFQLESPRGRELVIRHLAVEPELIVDDALCRALASDLLVKQMKLVEEAEIRDAAVAGWPGTTGGLRILHERAGTLRDIHVFARRGEIVVGILELPDGRADAEFGTALRVLASVRGAAAGGLARPRIDALGRVERPTHFVVADLDLYDDEGTSRRPRATRLTLAPDGRFHLAPTGLGLDTPTAGSYRIVAGRLALEHADGALSLELDPSLLTLRAANGRTLYRVPDLP